MIDTRGINVWCAGGKGTFSAEEISYQVERCNLANLVSHRQLILPQLSANGVAAHKLKTLCGFKGSFGPILASHIPDFLQSKKASEEMQTVTFSLMERAVLIPLEICMLWKPLLLFAITVFILSGFSPEIFSTEGAVRRGSTLVYATFTAIFTGACATPLFLPWIPFRQFWLKGVITGIIGALIFLAPQALSLHGLEQTAIFLFIISCSSYLAMNFTGSTPFTSLSGVEKEMRNGLPFQIFSVALSLMLWISSPFILAP